MVSVVPRTLKKRLDNWIAKLGNTSRNFLGTLLFISTT